MAQKPYDDHIKLLAKKWMQGTITPEEEVEFATWYNLFDDEAELVLSREFANDEEELQQRIFDTVNKRLMLKATTVHKFPLKRKLVAVAAVTVFFLIGWAVYKLIIGKDQPSDTPGEITVFNDILPGGNKGGLLLADGSYIALGKEQQDVVAVKGKGQFTQLDDGEIACSETESSNSNGYNTLTTPKGGQYRLRLPDGTRVWLNSASSIKFPTAFNKNRREVEVTGMVYFEVAKRASQPFIAKSRGMEVKVLGTHFCINTYDKDQVGKVSLIEGKVEVYNLSSNILKTLHPGQQADLAQNGNIVVQDSADLTSVVAWKDGFFDFEDSDLPSVMRQIEQWYDIEVIFEGAITREKFGGRISRNLPLSKILHLLKLNGIDFQMNGRRLLIK
ncbi:FecR family protein [Niabella sp. CJ426]|uniref:FecR family protein n=1 Tax=Niabella sp. CJ426 TaxID=3393740 RepID=UPI003CFD5A5E